VGSLIAVMSTPFACSQSRAKNRALACAGRVRSGQRRVDADDWNIGAHQAARLHACGEAIADARDAKVRGRPDGARFARRGNGVGEGLAAAAAGGEQE